MSPLGKATPHLLFLIAFIAIYAFLYFLGFIINIANGGWGSGWSSGPIGMTPKMLYTASKFVLDILTLPAQLLNLIFPLKKTFLCELLLLLFSACIYALSALIVRENLLKLRNTNKSE